MKCLKFLHLISFYDKIKFMITDKDRLFYYIGTGLLAVAIFEVTVLPYSIMRFFPWLFIPVDIHRTAVSIIYFLTFLFYAFSGKYFKKQLITIFIFFIIYALFQIIVQQI